MNRAGRAKATMVAFALEHGVQPQGNETVLQLKALTTSAAIMSIPAHESDPVGFGPHSEKTYEEVRDDMPKYKEEVLKIKTNRAPCVAVHAHTKAET